MSAHELPSIDAPAHTSRRRHRRRSTLVVLGISVLTALLASTVGLPPIPDHDGLARAGHDALGGVARTGATGSAGQSPGAAGVAGVGRLARARRLAGPPPVRAELTIGAGAAASPIPRSFLGLSTEYWSLPLYERHMTLFEQAVSLLRVHGDGPQILRIGGDSADHAFWDPLLRRLPWWAFKLTPAWLTRISALVHRVRVRLILDLNLVTDSPKIAAEWARAAEVELPRGSIIGFEVGNEPDLYAHWYWLASIGRSRLAANVLPRALSAGIYAQDFRSYAGMLARIAPRVPLAGPAVANPQRSSRWLMRLLSGPHPGLGIVSAHRYPFSACVRPTARAYPTISRLLSERASAGLARSVARPSGLRTRPV
jgi:hypothetical protein